MNPLAVDQAARLLVQCHRERSRIQQLPSTCAPSTLADAYRIQRSVAQLMDKRLAGYKVGLTNEDAQRVIGVFEPIAGPIYSDCALKNEAQLLPTHSQMRAVEAEVIFKIGATLSPGSVPFDRSCIVASIEQVFAGIEVCDSRFVDCDKVSLASIVADNSNSGVIVVGEPFATWSEADFDAMTVSLSRANEIVATGSTANVLRNPLNSLQWLANWLAARNIALEAGQLIATGTCTPVATAQANERFVADFGKRARTTVEFVRA